MAIAKRLRKHLERAGVPYDVIKHRPTVSASKTAQVAHISGELVAKGVVLQDEDGYMLVAVPSTHRVELDALGRAFDRSVNLATESGISELFDDCAVGAVPPIGNAYGIEILLDESLTALSDIYFEAGDHRSLVHMSGTDFAFLMIDAQRGTFSHHV